MDKLTVSASPHIVKPHNSTARIMLDVIIALVPVMIASIFFFGHLVLINIIVCVLSCVGSELLFNLIKSKNFTKQGIKESSIWDLSCVVTGILLALNLPPYIKVWGGQIMANGVVVFSFDTLACCILGSVFAIVITKMLFGGIGKNFANPALMGRIFLFLSFTLIAKNTIFSGLGLQPSTGATWLESGNIKKQNLLLDLFIGNTGSAAVGETCKIALLIGFIYLVVRKVIDFRLPLIIVGSAALFALIFDGLIKNHLTGMDLITNMLAHVLSGGLMFGAIFMATDYSTSPNTFVGNVIYGVGIALITIMIRVFGSYPEGMSFAIIIMNIATPLIDSLIIPKPFGYIKEKKIKLKGAK